ncbi:hypothetical protein SH83_07505 [Lactiplantibacillus plantarum]|nr:hypothetical protein SH83_07505 [Lactiplantibacillus plantarum]KKX44666.1 hypothetical protein WH27_01795 [Lactiplantibacillus plantarum]QBX94490.1 hypothetical protein DVH03_09160 [Lactiplantibacillus plantarum]QDJ16947.1 hypothetical protein CL175_07345 [Lactiplantibacillus plantarum]RCI91082.1 hypothetical protein DT256_02600 [Lactiplantibacillus plantarum]
MLDSFSGHERTKKTTHCRQLLVTSQWLVVIQLGKSADCAPDITITAKIVRLRLIQAKNLANTSFTTF